MVLAMNETPFIDDNLVFNAELEKMLLNWEKA